MDGEHGGSSLLSSVDMTALKSKPLAILADLIAAVGAERVALPALRKEQRPLQGCSLYGDVTAR